MVNFVATPIGNLKDITLRALDALKNSDIICCEDTRTSKTLLAHYGIKNKTLIAYHKFNEKEISQKILNFAKSGKEICVISDAGTPAISDPGEILVKVLIENKVEFSVIPGPCALISGLVLSGFETKNFYFAGFLPEKNADRKNLILNILTLKSSIVFYVSSHNLIKDIDFLFENLGNRKACLVKEISKIYESKYYFNLSNPPVVDNRGEFVLVVEGASFTVEQDMSIKDHVKFYIAMGYGKNEAIKKVAKEREVNKNTVYLEVLNL